ncbi:MAG: ABC transporter permease [Chloroflexia bacterium]|nr:ABC transporter permease [Chloroflexia bacterium]
MTDEHQRPRPPADPPATAEIQPAAEPLTLSGRAVRRLLLNSGSGRASLALFALMLGICVWVLATYPPNFGNDRWSNPVVWADNPKVAPPVWTNALPGVDRVEHQVDALDQPVEIRTIPAGEVRVYESGFDFAGGEAPSFLSLSLNGVSFSGRPPVVIATLIRPDGAEINLVSIPITAARPGETQPIRRFYETPERVVLTTGDAAARAITTAYQQTYPGVPAPNLAERLNVALFARPDADAPNGWALLPGTYRMRVQVVTADPATEVAPIKVVWGGTVFGWMGTDNLGRDLLEGLLFGFPLALAIAALASLLSTAIGASLGVLSGYAGGMTDAVIQRLSDIVSNVPTLPLLIFLVFVLGSHLWLIILVLVAFSWPGLTILVRSMVLQVRAGQLVEAARALGASRRRIMVRHVFPQVAPFIIAQMIFFAPGAILAEASLSFLGLGDTSTPTWGQMLEAGFRTGALYVGYWWWVLPPGLLIVLTAIAFMLLALAMEPIVDPRLRRQR